MRALFEAVDALSGSVFWTALALLMLAVTVTDRLMHRVRASR
jgi:hypothetical protein